MPLGSAQDVPAASGDLFEFETVVRNTVKPIFFCGYSSKGIEYIIEMAKEVAGGGQQQLFFKDSYNAWVKNGKTTLEERADKRVADILSGHVSPSLPEKVLARLKVIREKGVEDIG